TMVIRHSRILPGAAALVSIFLIQGCTATGGIDMAAELEAVAADPELPAQVAVVPTSAEKDEFDEQLAASIVPVGYAGPTPTDSKAELTAGGFPIRKVEARSPELDRLIARYAAVHEIPESLLRRVVNRESTFNPAARNGPYLGLMQILPATARTMGYRGAPDGLLDAETNLKYAGKYLRGAYLVCRLLLDKTVRYDMRASYNAAQRKW